MWGMMSRRLLKWKLAMYMTLQNRLYPAIYRPISQTNELSIGISIKLPNKAFIL